VELAAVVAAAKPVVTVLVLAPKTVLTAPQTVEPAPAAVEEESYVGIISVRREDDIKCHLHVRPSHPPPEAFLIRPYKSLLPSTTPQNRLISQQVRHDL
jgi:hypothetical protein